VWRSDDLGGSRVLDLSRRDPLVRAARSEGGGRRRDVEGLLRIASGSSGRAIRLPSLWRSDNLGGSRARDSSRRDPLVGAVRPEGRDRRSGVAEGLLQIASGSTG
jgi:hypothetical protein